MNIYDAYLYGMIIYSNSFWLKDGFLKRDEYSEITEKHCFVGGETGTCATILSSLGLNVKIDGTYIGKNHYDKIKNFYNEKNVDISSLYLDNSFDGLEDYVIISDSDRTPMGMFGAFFKDAYESKIKRWNRPKENDIICCKVAAIDSFFGEDSELAAKFCVENKKPYVTIDCPYDSYIHKNSAISVISGESLRSSYPDITREKIFKLFKENGNGLTIITNGGNELIYGRKNEEPHFFHPFNVNVVSTLGAGDTFKAGCTYALLKNMSDYDTVRFASACAAVAISRYPMQKNPPKLNEVMQLIK